MGTRHIYSLSDGHKTKLRKQIIIGARNYKKYLTGKVFKIICEDGTEVDVRFFGSDFKHLTGLDSNLDNEKFYKNCVCGIIDIGNINNNQKYNWATLRTKGKSIEKIHELLYSDCQKTLLLELLHTNTFIFPYAVKNVVNNICVGFASDANKARSLRKASSSLNSKSQKSIIAIFAKLSERDKYHELVYVSNVVGIYKKDEGLLNKLDNNIQMKFLEIITRH